MNRANKKWVRVWRLVATDSMSLEVSMGFGSLESTVHIFEIGHLNVHKNETCSQKMYFTVN